MGKHLIWSWREEWKKNHDHSAHLFQAKQGDFRPKSQREIGPTELTLTLLFPLHKFWRTEREREKFVWSSYFCLNVFGVIRQEIFASLVVIPLDDVLYAILTHIQSNYQRCVENWPKCVYPIASAVDAAFTSEHGESDSGKKRTIAKVTEKRKKKTHAIRWDLLRLWLDDICYPLDTVWLFELFSFFSLLIIRQQTMASERTRTQ